MKKLLLIFYVSLAALVLPMRAQDATDAAARQDELKRFNSTVEELTATQATLQKKIEKLTAEVDKLRDEAARTDKLDKFATKEDFDTLAAKLKELDKQRQNDRELVLGEIKKMEKLLATGTEAPRQKGKKPAPKADDSTTTIPPAPPAAGPPPGSFEYVIQPGDTLSTIAQGINKEHHLKVTVKMIEQANPGLKAEKLMIGKPINIPGPAKTASRE
ncbi:MAG: LysM peptidoglycan-binding domain-containing protein [Verrucomicrobia bacterium]|nr:LysM peptidoglycan-binding domain-containing protein [Verrucomicrobiota bacterium]